MDSSAQRLERAAFFCAFGSASFTVVSIAISQSLLGICLGLILVLVLTGKMTLRFPPISLPLGLFVLGTLVSLALSDHPMAGIPQIRKFFVYLILLAVACTFREIQQVRWLVLAWLTLGSVAAIRGIVQFAVKFFRPRPPGVDFYHSYVGERITGFFSHWMTFSGVMMVVFLLGLALLFWGKPSRYERILAWSAAGLAATAILLGFTRGIWVGAGVATLFLLWNWRRVTVLALPALLVVIVAANPVGLRTRLTSFIQPQGTTDSNQHRIVTWRTGLEMIKAHPWFGVGPEHIKLQFNQYIPPDIPKPLPEGWYGHLHNNYLQYAAERGIPTLLMLLWAVGRILRDWWIAPPSWIRYGGVAALMAILITGLFELNLGDSEVLLMTMALVSAVYAGLRAPATAAQT